MSKALNLEIDTVRLLVWGLIALKDKSLLSDQDLDDASALLDLLVQLQDDLVAEELAEKLEEEAVREFGEA